MHNKTKQPTEEKKPYTQHIYSKANKNEREKRKKCDVVVVVIIIVWKKAQEHKSEKRIDENNRGRKSK